jgi:hypothetical protein
MKLVAYIGLTLMLFQSGSLFSNSETSPYGEVLVHHSYNLPPDSFFRSNDFQLIAGSLNRVSKFRIYAKLAENWPNILFKMRALNIDLDDLLDPNDIDRNFMGHLFDQDPKGLKNFEDLFLKPHFLDGKMSLNAIIDLAYTYTFFNKIKDAQALIYWAPLNPVEKKIALHFFTLMRNAEKLSAAQFQGELNRIESLSKFKFEGSVRKIIMNLLLRTSDAQYSSQKSFFEKFIYSGLNSFGLSQIEFKTMEKWLKNFEQSGILQTLRPRFLRALQDDDRGFINNLNYHDPRMYILFGREIESYDVPRKEVVEELIFNESVYKIKSLNFLQSSLQILEKGNVVKRIIVLREFRRIEIDNAKIVTSLLPLFEKEEDLNVLKEYFKLFNSFKFDTHKLISFCILNFERNEFSPAKKLMAIKFIKNQLSQKLSNQEKSKILYNLNKVIESELIKDKLLSFEIFRALLEVFQNADEHNRIVITNGLKIILNQRSRDLLTSYRAYLINIDLADFSEESIKALSTFFTEPSEVNSIFIKLINFSDSTEYRCDKALRLFLGE